MSCYWLSGKFYNLSSHKFLPTPFEGFFPQNGQWIKTNQKKNAEYHFLCIFISSIHFYDPSYSHPLDLINFQGCCYLNSFIKRSGRPRWSLSGPSVHNFGFEFPLSSNFPSQRSWHLHEFMTRISRHRGRPYAVRYPLPFHATFCIPMLPIAVMYCLLIVPFLLTTSTSLTHPCR